MWTTAIGRLQEYFRCIQNDLGYWWGELESNNTMEAEYVMLSRFLGHHNPERERHIVNYILSKQLDDGGWAVYYGAPGDLSTSVECYFALKLCGEDPGRRTHAPGPPIHPGPRRDPAGAHVHPDLVGALWSMGMGRDSPDCPRK